MTKKKFYLFPSHCEKKIIISTLLLVLFSSLMIVSADMGKAAGDTSVITRTAIKQGIVVFASIIAMIFFTKVRVFNFRLGFYKITYIAILVSLFITRLFPPINGSYAWIQIPGINFTIQPSEFAKVFLVMLAAKVLGTDRKENNKIYFKRFIVYAIIYFCVILFVQKDLGSAVVLACMCYLVILIIPYKELDIYRFRMVLILFLGIILMVFLLSPLGTSLLENFSGSYRIARFLASANPFAYQYDAGYHLIMGLASFGTGGFVGVGYGQSIHKYMNFPNPSSDFILPVIIEELGIVFGLIPIIVMYSIILFSLVKNSLLIEKLSSKIILFGCFAYFTIHFILNVGGVTGLIPLTGVPLLLVSSGGTSFITAMSAIGICENEIINSYKCVKK